MISVVFAALCAATITAVVSENERDRICDTLDREYKSASSMNRTQIWYQDGAVIHIVTESLTIELLNGNLGPTSLDLEGKGIKHLSEDFANIPSLEWLTLEDNLIEDIPSAVFAGLPGLRYLNLGRNHIASLGKDSFNGLDRLTILNLDHNDLSAIDVDFFHNLPDLTHLYLRHNRISSFQSFGQLSLYVNSRITHLYLSCNLLTYFNGYNELVLTNLTHLFLENNLLYKFEPSGMPLVSLSMDGNRYRVTSRMPHIKFLSMSYSECEPDCDSYFENYKNLSGLVLSHNKIKNLPNKISMLFLEYLSFDHNKLSYIKPEIFATLPVLKDLRLDYNQITSIFNGAFENLPLLKTLTLDGNRLTQIAPEVFENIPRLRELSLSFNQLDHLPSVRGLKLHRLDVSNNRIMNVSDLHVDTLPLKWLKITGNPLKIIDEKFLPRGVKIHI